MPEVLKTPEFDQWLRKMRDDRARARILTRIDRLVLGNPGDAKTVGGNVSELRVDYGPGYRVYFTRRGEDIILLLCGGDKSTQDNDIKFAKALAAEWTP